MFAGLLVFQISCKVSTSFECGFALLTFKTYPTMSSKLLHLRRCSKQNVQNVGSLKAVGSSPGAIQVAAASEVCADIPPHTRLGAQQDNFSVIEPIRQRGELRGQLVLAKWTPSL